MGLLDDAIREHLELKRLGGADPGEVAHEEQEALGSVHDDEMAHDAQDEQHVDMTSSDSDGSLSVEEHGSVGGGPTTGEETVEIDMRTVLDRAVERDPGREVAPVQSGHGPDDESPVDDAAHAPGGDESLEWEIPNEKHAEGGMRDEHHEDRLSTDDARIDDVLEETPDFLRETPEQERLWFEQRPPRDFDFNE
jgi:hypothetical protein